MRIVRDQDCPSCGWPETYVEGEAAPERFGCPKCVWSAPVVAQTPEQRLQAELAGYGVEPSSECWPGEYDDSKPFLLVEENGGEEPQWWVTLHASPDDASTYHNTQECRGDWEIEVLIDLRDGSRFTEQSRVTIWEPAK